MIWIGNKMVFAIVFLVIGGCAHTSLGRDSTPGESEEGLACYYSDTLHGKLTASGETYDKQGFTAAHRELPFGTVVRVTNMNNRRFVEVRINDRGPSNSKRRIIDLSRAAAERIGMIQSGVVPVGVEIVSLKAE